MGLTVFRRPDGDAIVSSRYPDPKLELSQQLFPNPWPQNREQSSGNTQRRRSDLKRGGGQFSNKWLYFQDTLVPYACNTYHAYTVCINSRQQLYIIVIYIKIISRYEDS